MALPPKGDPRRPLHLAVRSTRMLAIIFLLFGSCAFVPFLIRGAMPVNARVFLELGNVILYFGPGAVYLVTSIYLMRRRFWAVVVAIVLASIQLLLVLIGIISLLIVMMRQPIPQPVSSFALIPAGILLLIILALVQLIYHLALSFEAIKYIPVEEQHGFEPLMAQPVEPPHGAKGESNGEVIL